MYIEQVPQPGKRQFTHFHGVEIIVADERVIQDGPINNDCNQSKSGKDCDACFSVYIISKIIGGFVAWIRNCINLYPRCFMLQDPEILHASTHYVELLFLSRKQGGITQFR